MKFVRKITYATEQEILRMYAAGNTMTKISNALGVSNSTPGWYLRKNHIQIRPRWKRKYNLDENFFAAIDSQEKAQILGFLYADGCLIETNHTVSFTLTESDNYYLRHIAACMHYSGPIIHSPAKECRGRNGKIYVARPYSSLRIGSIQN